VSLATARRGFPNFESSLVTQKPGISDLWIEPCGTATRGFPNCGSSLVAQQPGNFLIVDRALWHSNQGFPNCGSSLVAQQPGDFLAVDRALWHSNQEISLLWIEPCGIATRRFSYCGSSLVAQQPRDFQSAKASNHSFTIKSYCTNKCKCKYAKTPVTTMTIIVGRCSYICRPPQFFNTFILLSQVFSTF